MMETNKYILCGDENLRHTYEGCGISEKGKRLFNKWAIESLADPCSHGKEAFLDIPVSSERRLLIRAFYEHNKGNRALTWYLGIEFSREDIKEASCYANFVRGMLAISLETMKNLRRGEVLSVNLQYPSGLPQIQTPFKELKGKNFYGEYPRILWEFCQKISLNDMADWFEQLFLAVNVEVECIEYTNMVCEIPPQLIERPAPPLLPPAKPPMTSPPIAEPTGSPSGSKGWQGKMRTIFFLLWSGVTIGAVCWGIAQFMEPLSNTVLESKDRIHRKEMASLTKKYKVVIAQKDQRIQQLNAKITILSAPKDIVMTLNKIDTQISCIERRLNSINKKLEELEQCLREPKKACGHTADPKPQHN